MTYPSMNSTLAGQDISYFFIYANEVTKGFFGHFFILGFFLVVFLGSLFMQFRTTARVRPETSALASSFVTFGLAVLLQSKNGIIAPSYTLFFFALSLLSLIWVIMSND